MCIDVGNMGSRTVHCSDGTYRIIETGAITWLLHQDWPPARVAERGNASVKTIEQHYDRADPHERRCRLRERIENMEIAYYAISEITNR